MGKPVPATTSASASGGGGGGGGPSRASQQPSQQQGASRSAAAVAAAADEEGGATTRASAREDAGGGDELTSRRGGGGGGGKNASALSGGSGAGRFGTTNANANANDDEPEEEILEERTVIHEQLVRAALHKELHHHYHPHTLPPASSLPLTPTSLSTLLLSSLNLFTIDHLRGYTSLTKLQLDNNKISRIENLDHLVNLTWLDLSFNRITKIENLDKLTKLTDLSLFQNQIRDINGLDSLVHLQVLSLGNNQISSLSSLSYLRKFPALRVLNLAGNPIHSEEEYRPTIIAFLSSLSYLDYVRIEKKAVEKARDKMLDHLLVMETKEKEEEETRKADEERRKRDEEKRAANIDGVATLLTDIAKDDREQQKLRVLPGFTSIMSQFASSFSSTIGAFEQEIMQRKAEKDHESSMCIEVIERIRKNAEEETRARLKEWEKRKKAWRNEFDHSPVFHHSVMFQTYISSLQQLVSTLLSLEMHTVDQVHKLTDELERNYMQLIATNVTAINTMFRQLSELTQSQGSQIFDLAHQSLERYAKDDPVLMQDPDARQLLADKEGLNGMINAMMENQVSRILQKEDEVREREEAEGKRLLKQLRQIEFQRNRMRMGEVETIRAREERFIKQLREGEEAYRDDDDDDEDELFPASMSSSSNHAHAHAGNSSSSTTST